jgi:hypothetical protein
MEINEKNFRKKIEKSMYKIKTSDFFNNTIDKELLNIDIVKNISQDSFISKYSNLYVVYSLSFKIEFCFKENMNLYYIMVEKFLEQNRKNTLLEYEDDLLIFDKTKNEIEKKIEITINNDNIKLNNIELYFSEEEIDSLYFFDNS